MLYVLLRLYSLAFMFVPVLQFLHLGAMVQPVIFDSSIFWLYTIVLNLALCDIPL